MIWGKLKDQQELTNDYDFKNESYKIIKTCLTKIEANDIHCWKTIVTCAMRMLFCHMKEVVAVGCGVVGLVVDGAKYNVCLV